MRCRLCGLIYRLWGDLATLYIAIEFGDEQILFTGPEGRCTLILLQRMLTMLLRLKEMRQSTELTDPFRIGRGVSLATLRFQLEFGPALGRLSHLIHRDRIW